MKYLLFPLIVCFMLLSACSTDEASEYERTNAAFLDSLGGDGISPMHWWRTAVWLKINVTTDEPVKLWLLSSQNVNAVLYDYKEVKSSEIVTMTAPQGQGNTLYLKYLYKNKTSAKTIVLSGKPEESITLNTTTRSTTTRAGNPPASLCGSSIRSNARYYQFTPEQLNDYYTLMSLDEEKSDAKYTLNLNTNYELESNGEFYITWVTGNEADQKSRILGYYYHSPTTFDDIKYVDLSETHKWDYIDGLAKVQYQISISDNIDGHQFKPNTWYDGNFDMHDVYGSSRANNGDRVGDNCYAMQAVYDRYKTNISALRGISFKIDVPNGMRIGFYLRSDEEPYPAQWTLLKSEGIKPYVSNPADFMGTNFCVEFMNIQGNGRGQHRSFIKDYDEVYWMGMEDLIEGGDHDCNDVIFGVVADLKILMPTIVDPTLKDSDPDPEPEPEPVESAIPFPWTVAYEDVNRNPDFDFNDAVIKLMPDYENELCCVTVMAAGSTARMYLHYDGPDGDVNMGEIHQLLGSKNSNTYINTQGALAGTPFNQVDCVPWPAGYTMANDAKRFYIEIQRGTCNDCTDVITLANEPGIMPEALLVAGEWQWPMEGVHIFDTYSEFPRWAQDVTRTRFWEWYKSPALDNCVSY